MDRPDWQYLLRGLEVGEVTDIVGTVLVADLLFGRVWGSHWAS